MKKTIARLTAAVAACTAVLAASLPASAAADITVSSNFAGASGDVANGSMLTTFPELEAVNKNARIKNSFGKRCIGMGAGENSAAELVYKLTVPEGEQLTELPSRSMRCWPRGRTRIPTGRETSIPPMPRFRYPKTASPIPM